MLQEKNKMATIVTILILTLIKTVLGEEINCTTETTELLTTFKDILSCSKDFQNDILASSDLSGFPAFHSVLNSICENMIDHNSTDQHNKATNKLEEISSHPKTWEIWLYGNVCVFCISICSLFGAFLSPLQKTKVYKNALTVLIGLAVGSLSGSSAFHLIPQAFGLVGTAEQSRYLHVALALWIGIWGFFQIEAILKIIEKCKSIEPHTHNHMHEGAVSAEMRAFMNHNNSHTEENFPTRAQQNTRSTATAVYHESSNFKEISTRKNDNQPAWDIFYPSTTKKPKIAPVAYMVVFGDAIHNFIDGVSIGAAFTDNLWTGISVSVAVFCEELPHELGDFAVLLNSGMSVKLAVCCNFLSACTCFAGFAVGVLLGEIYASEYIFAFAAGMFLYISLADMIPEMNHVASEAFERDWKTGCFMLMQQNFGILLGVTILYALAWHQENLSV